MNVIPQLPLMVMGMPLLLDIHTLQIFPYSMLSNQALVVKKMFLLRR